MIDKDSVDVETQQIFSYYNIDVLNLGRELELEKKWFLCRTPQRLLHIFDELYAAKGVEGRDYFRIKLLELFYHIKQLRIEDQYEATYYASGTAQPTKFPIELTIQPIRLRTALRYVFLPTMHNSAMRATIKK